MPFRYSCRLMAAALVAAAGTMPGRTEAQADVSMRRLFSSDTMTAQMSQASPDGRWVVMRVVGGAGINGGSLWIAPVGGAPSRLTSDGFEDRFPAWFRSGDAVAFGSTRFNRNGGRGQFLAVQKLDPATGRPVGVPRQVSSEPISRHGQPSPDGRWLSYVTIGSPAELKVVPANGGTARTVARLEGVVGAAVFDPDSRYLYYREVTGTPGAMRFALKRVTVAGGAAPEVVATASHQVSILPADPRYVIHEATADPTRYEIRTLGGELVGGVSLPRGMRSPTYSGDGWGIMGLRSDWKGSVQVASLDGGEPKVVVAGGQHWPEAWMPDGSAVITDRATGDGFLLETVALNGAVLKRTTLPVGAVHSGWQSSVGPWMSYRMRAPSGTADVLHAVNVMTGGHREISSAAVRVGVSGRGGYEQDGSRWVFVQRNTESGRLELRSADPASGGSTLLATLPAEHRFDQNVRLAVHGNRAVYGQARGDSVDLYLIDGPSARPRRIASFSKDVGAVTWSWDGSTIAVADWLPGTPRRGGLHLISVGSTSAAPSIRRIDLGLDNGCDSFTWTPDDSHVVMLCYGTAGRILKVRVRDGQLGTVLASDRPQQIWEYYLSPDGRNVAYTVQRDAGVSVHVASFRTLLEGRAR